MCVFSVYFYDGLDRFLCVFFVSFCVSFIGFSLIFCVFSRFLQGGGELNMCLVFSIHIIHFPLT